MPAFDDTYQELLGDRWPALRAALTRPGPYSVCLNPLHPAAGDQLPAGASPVPGLEGVYAHDEFARLRLRPKTYYVVNTGHSRGGGIHWVAVYRGAGKTVYVYDSFGRATGSILPDLKKALEARGYSIVEADRDAEQRGASEVCGHLSLAWLEVVHRYGVLAALEV